MSKKITRRNLDANRSNKSFTVEAGSNILSQLSLELKIYKDSVMFKDEAKKDSYQ